MYANVDNESCEYGVKGCMDQTAANYDAMATVSDGSCVILGCQDPQALNFNELATHPTSCVFLSFGCTVPSALNYDPTANVLDNSCVAKIPGCTLLRGNFEAGRVDAAAPTRDHPCAAVDGDAAAPTRIVRRYGGRWRRRGRVYR